MPQFTEKSHFDIMSVRIKSQHLKALERAPQGTLSFRSYLLMIHGNLKCNKAFGGRSTLMEQICYIWNKTDTSELYGIEMYGKKP